MSERHNDFILPIIFGGVALLLVGMIIGFLLGSKISWDPYKIDSVGEPVVLDMQAQAALELRNYDNAYHAIIGVKGDEIGSLMVDKIGGKIDYFYFYYPDHEGHLFMNVSLISGEILLANFDNGLVKIIPISSLFEGVAE